MFDLSTIIETPISLIGRLADTIRSARSTSLTQYTAPTRAEPITLVDSSLLAYPDLSKILQSAVSLYAAYYIQAIYLSINVGKIDVIRLLEKVNPARDPIDSGSMMLETALSGESYNYLFPGPRAIATESSGDEIVNSAINHRDTINSITAAPNLCVGKVFNVPIRSETDEANIIVAVRLLSFPTEPETLGNILTYAQKDLSIKERFYGFKAGRLRLIQDNVLCLDLIREHRKALVKDKSGVYADMIKRANKNRLAGLVSANPSVGTASNIIVIRKSVAKQIELEMGAKFSDAKVRQRIFDKTYLMMMFIVDDMYDQVTAYYNGISIGSQLSIQDIKQFGNKENMDVSEIMRTLRMGDSPRF